MITRDEAVGDVVKNLLEGSRSSGSPSPPPHRLEERQDLDDIDDH